MSLSKAFISWKNWIDTHQYYFSKSVLILFSIAFIVSDWMYNYFTFSEYILFIILTFFILTFQIYVSKKQFYIIGLLGLILCFHNIFQIYNNEYYQLNTGIAASIKLMFYVGTTVVTYNYIKKFKLERKLVVYNSIFAFLVILVGIYITIQLYQESRIPQEFFWKFTRRDIYSYYFESNPSIIRTRSLFSEPAHMGFYLNTISAVILFSNIKIPYEKFVVCLLVLGVLLSLSYSMIAIMLVIIFLKLVLLVYNRELKWNNWMLSIPLIIGIVLLYFWDTVNTTLIERTVKILSGEDISARMRLLDSWEYVRRDNLLLGNGIGHTPIITNVYAYALSDLGLGGLIGSFVVTGFFIYKNWTLGIVFLLLNMAKGGYLSSSYWFMVILILIYSSLINNTKRNI